MIRVRNLILISTFILYSLTSYAEVGERFNCILEKAEYIGRDNWKNRDNSIIALNNTDASKLLLITILNKKQAKFEHKYGSDTVPFELFYNGVYTGLKIHEKQIVTDIFFKKTSPEKWVLRLISVTAAQDTSINYSKYNCMILK